MRTIGSKFSLGNFWMCFECLAHDAIDGNLTRFQPKKILGFTALMNGFFALLVALMIAKFTFDIHLTFVQLWYFYFDDN